MAGSYIVPGDAKSDGKCERNTASLKIILNEGNISMNFVKVCQEPILIEPGSGNRILFADR